MTSYEEFIKDWLTSLVETDGILMTISLMILTILYTSGAVAHWQATLIGSVVLVASILLMLSAFFALDAHGTLILQVKETNAERRQVLSEKTRSRAKKARQLFKASLMLLLTAIILVVVLPNLPTTQAWR